MDFLRSTIKTLFHDIPLKDILEMASKETSDKEFFDHIEELLIHRETSFSGREIEGLRYIMNKEWFGDIKGLPSFLEKAHTLPERIFIILKAFGEKAINTDQQHPRVIFPQLLRWADLSRYVEENVILLPFLAYDDIERNITRTSFVWPNVLRHDNANINGILESGMADIHCHLYASTDVFEFNWLMAMNFPETTCVSLDNPDTNIKHIEEPDFLTTGRRLSYDSVVRFGGLELPLNKWMLIAAWLRLNIYENLIGESRTPWEIDPNDILSIGDNPNSLYTDIRATRNWLRSTRKGQMASNGFMPDYLISTETGADEIPHSDLLSPYMIHHGERWLIYSYFKKYFGEGDEKIRKYAPYVWLYLAIRSKIRREFVQVNQLIGFDNFQRYQRRKTRIIGKKGSALLNDIAIRYAIQSTLHDNPNSFLEGRISPSEATQIIHNKYHESIFGNETILSEADRGRFSFVIHFLKGSIKGITAKGGTRYSALQRRYKKDLKKVIQHQEWQNKKKKTGLFGVINPEFVGIDAAGAEIGCRPEVFKDIFRQAQEHGIHNLTYHVGEDFYDILDGMRAIDELSTYLGFRRGCRLGHGLALATDPENYYASRHKTMILPAQELLDNLIWMKTKGAELDIRFTPSSDAFILSQTSRLISEIGYSDADIEKYAESLNHRCDDDSTLNEQSDDIKNIVNDYRFNPDVIAKGLQTVHVHLPAHWAEDVTLLQEALLFEFEKKGIAVECNPTSNLRIGRFRQYADHPVFVFHGVKYDRKHTIPVTVNTDDSGVFGTSLANEYSLLAAAMYKETDSNGKRLYSDREIEEYIESLARYSKRSRFTI